MQILHLNDDQYHIIKALQHELTKRKPLTITCKLTLTFCLICLQSFLKTMYQFSYKIYKIFNSQSLRTPLPRLPKLTRLLKLLRLPGLPMLLRLLRLLMLLRLLTLLRLLMLLMLHSV